MHRSRQHTYRLGAFKVSFADRSLRTADFRDLSSRLYPFTPKRFHALLNSLFKVLFNFPSRYLFAIGLAVIFSLRWDLPPTLGCTLKQPDSIENPTRRRLFRYGPSTLYGVPIKGAYETRTTSATTFVNATGPNDETPRDSALGLFPFTRRY